MLKLYVDGPSGGNPCLGTIKDDKGAIPQCLVGAGDSNGLNYGCLEGLESEKKRVCELKGGSRNLTGW